MRTAKKLGDGREIIAREPALGAHPHPSQNSRLVPYNGVTKLLIADGAEMYECDECGWTADSTKSVASHMSGAHSDRGPMYDISVIRKIIRIAAIERRDRGLRGTNERTAKILNDQGIATVKGGPWTAATVHSIVAKYRNIYPVKLRRLQAVDMSAAADTVTTDRQDEARAISLSRHPAGRKLTQVVNEADIDARLAELAKAASALTDVGIDLSKQVHVIAQAVSKMRTIDPEIAEKARKYDEFRNWMRD